MNIEPTELEHKKWGHKSIEKIWPTIIKEIRGIPLLPKHPLGLQKPEAVGNSLKMGVIIVGLFGQKHVQNITEKTVRTKYEENR